MFIDITTISQKGRTVGPTLSQQVKALIGDGNQAYVDNDPAEAIRIMQEVIRIEVHYRTSSQRSMVCARSVL